MIGIVLLIVFLLGLSFFGWQIARVVFKINRIESLLPLSITIGYGFYTFILNISSYLIPIKLNFYFVFGFLLLIAFVLFFLNRQKPKLEYGLSKKGGVVIFSVTIIIMILSGLVSSRIIGADDLAYVHIPAVTSIAGGNFPVKNLNLPEYDMVAHYGSCLFYAAILRITGLSVFLAIHLTFFLFGGVFFLLIFNIAKLFIKNNKGSFLVALVGVFGGDLHFIYGFNFLVEIYKKFILHYNIEHPFAFLGNMWGVGPLTGSSIANAFNSWSTSILSYSLVLGIIYLYIKKLNTPKWSYYYDSLMIILLSILALNFEMGFIATCFGIAVIPFVFYLKNKNKNDFKELLKHSMLILIVVTVIVLLQGGTITIMFKNIVQHENSSGVGLGLSVFENPLSFKRGDGTIIPFYNSKFILNFGLIYFLIIPAIIFVFKKYFKEGIFLIIISCFSFFVPLFISFNRLWQDTINYFFQFNSLIWAILVGVFLVTILSQLKNKRILKVIIYICIIIICLKGVLFLLTRPTYKRIEYRIDNNHFFVTLRPLSVVESSAYGWAKKNSVIKDYFLVFADKNDIENQVSVLENFRFVIFTQRLAPIYTNNNNSVSPIFLPDDDYYTPLYKKLISDCNDVNMKLLNYRYLFVDNNWPVGLEEKCIQNNNLELRFQDTEGDKFIRIYQVR
jgi:hypothetical protein